MPNYYTPGVYTENSDVTSLSTTGTEGVGAFLGVAARGPLDKAIRITSWNAYIQNFALGLDSPFIADSDLAYAVYGFFQNGGAECIVGRVASATAASAKVPTSDTFKANIEAKDAGTWGNALSVAVTKNADDESLFDITVYRDGVAIETTLGVNNTVDDVNYWPTRLESGSDYIQSKGAGNVSVLTKTAMTGGNDGLSDLVDSDYEKTLTFFDSFTDIVAMAIPGQTSQTIRDILKKYCTEENVGIVPVIEAPKTATADDVKALRRANEFSTGVLVWPWGYVTDPLSKAASPNNVRLCPPSGHYIGVMSRIAQSRGIWKAAAGVEAVVQGFVSLAHNVTNEETDILNPAGVVTIKPVNNYGICVWGARSLNSKDPNFRYVSDLTLDTYIKRGVYDIGIPFVFEGNKEETWSDIETAVSSFMETLMNAGAFATNDSFTAYFVKCDADLNEIHVQKNDGIIETEVGYAGVKPAEFIVFKIKHTVS